MIREIIMKTLPSFGSIGQKLTKFCLFQFLWPRRRSERQGTGILRTTIKIRKIHSISYELHQYMPCNILILLIQFMLLLLHCSHSKATMGYSPWSFSILFEFTYSIYWVHRLACVIFHAKVTVYILKKLSTRVFPLFSPLSSTQFLSTSTRASYLTW